MTKNDFGRWAAAPPSWASSSDIGPMISTRIRLARNFSDVPFPHNSSAATQRDVMRRVFETAPSLTALNRGQNLSLNDFDSTERAFLMERQLISYQHARAEGERGLIVAPGELLSIMVNEEDHVRAAVFRGGLALDDAWTSLSQFDDELTSRLPMAYMSDFGYASACATNMGTGMRVSCLMHLPASVLTNRIGAILRGLSTSGLTVRGFYGEGTSPVGDLFQISNAHTLGRTETTILREVEKTVRQIGAIELKESAALISGDQRRLFEDRAHRAFGTLIHARLLDYAEAMQLMSLVRLGLRSGLELETTAEALNDLVFLAQPSHLRFRFTKSDGIPDAALRAQLVRERLSRRKAG